MLLIGVLRKNFQYARTRCYSMDIMKDELVVNGVSLSEEGLEKLTQVGIVRGWVSE